MLNSRPVYRFIQSRAQRALDRLEQLLQSGQLSTRAQLLGELAAAALRYPAGLSQPSLQVPRMGRDQLLVRDLLETPLAQADEDLQLAHEQVEQLRDFTRQVFNLCQAERSGLSDQLAAATADTDAFRLTASDSDPNFLWVGDTFNTAAQVDPSSTIRLDTQAGNVTLRPTSARSLSDRIVSARIDRTLSAGGLPGNNLEIHAPGVEAFTGDRPEPRPVLERETGSREDSLTALWDGQPDTWFEWERVYVPPQKLIKAGKAQVYDPAGKLDKNLAKLGHWSVFVRWPGDTQIDSGEKHKGYPLAYFQPQDRKELRLALEIGLDQPRNISWVQLTPLIHANAYPEVEQILVSNDGQGWQALLPAPVVLHPRMNRGIDFSSLAQSASNFEGVGVWSLPGVPLRYLKIILRQTRTYSPALGIGHQFYFKNGQRVKGQIPVAGSFAALPGEPESDDTESPSASKKRLREGFDVLHAERQAIAIRDLLLEERIYAETGQLVSKAFALPKPVRAVALLTAQQISAEYPDGEWLTYEISPDGQIWYPLLPQRTTREPAIVELPSPTTTLTLRATFNRPSDQPNSTPVLLAYALKAVPA